MPLEPHLDKKMMQKHSLAGSTLALFPAASLADGGASLDLLGSQVLLEAAGLALLGIAAFNLAVLVFVTLHITLLVLAIMGKVRGRYWRKGIQVCVLALLASYAGIYALVRSQ